MLYTRWLQPIFWATCVCVSSLSSRNARILGYTTKDGYNSVEHDYDLSAMDLVWVDQSASFLIYEEGTSVPHGYVASNGDRQFMAQPRPQSNTILVVSDGPGIAYIRLLYTKTTG